MKNKEHIKEVSYEAEELLLREKNCIKQCITRPSGYLSSNTFLQASTVKKEESIHKGEWIRVCFEYDTKKALLIYTSDGIAGNPDEKTVYADPLDLTAQDIKKFADNNI